MPVLRDLRGWVAPVLLGAIAVIGAFEPTASHAHAVFVRRVLGLDAVPAGVASAVAALLGLVAVLVALRGPRVLWPLLVLAAALWLARASGPMVFVASYCVAERWRRAGALVAYAAVAALVMGAPEIVADTAESGWAIAVQTALAEVAVFLLLPIVLGQWIGARRRELDGLRARAAQLQREREIRTAQARAEERTRIARDMHDVLAHRVSLMVLHAGALEVRAADPSAAAQAELIRETGRQALEQLREVLGVLRDPTEEGDDDTAPPPGRAELPALLEASRATGLTVRFGESGPSRALTVASDHALYRVVREALTNAHKYAGGAPVAVELLGTDDELEVVVRNGPPPVAHPSSELPGSGSGLVSLRERVELLGGRFSAGPELDGGFAVRAHLPVGSAAPTSAPRATEERVR